MSNIQNIDISLQEIVKNISRDSYLIPKFQRDFVWKTKDILDLGDSMIRGYPISSLLIMAENGTLNVGSHGLSKDDPPVDYEHKNEDNEIKFYILDGQQRLTSISKLFLTFDNKKKEYNEYYFDLLAILVEKFPEDDIQNDIGIQADCSVSKITDIFCKNFHISKDTKDRSEKPTRQNNRFISGKSIIDNKFGSVVSKFLRVFKNASEDNIDKYTDHLNAVLGSVGGYSIPATVIASDSELGVVIRVFEKVNSTGKKLTLFDLINAKSFQVKNESYKVGLSDYLTNEILKIISDRQDFKLGVYSFLKYDENNMGFEKLDKIIRIFEISYLLRKDAVPSIFQSTMLRKEPEFWFEMWNENGFKMLEIMSWMEDQGVIDIGQITFLEYAMAIFLANKKSFDLAKFKTEIKKYSLYLSLSDTGFNKSNLNTVERIYSISKQMTNSHESEKYNYDSPHRSPGLTADKVLDITSSKNSKFKAIMNIFYIDKTKGKFTVDISGNSIRTIDKSKMDYHHIFPKSRVKKLTSESKFNSIANFVLIDSITNRENIKDKIPKEYFSSINGQSEGKFHCDQNLIDIDAAMKIEGENDAEEFIKNRASMIAETINSYFEQNLTKKSS